jgi:hypothetical protein
VLRVTLMAFCARLAEAKPISAKATNKDRMLNLMGLKISRSHALPRKPEPPGHDAMRELNHGQIREASSGRTHCRRPD